MKKALFLFMIGIFSYQATAQIEMFDERIKKEEAPKALPYDSLSNIRTQKYGSGDNYNYTLHHLIGQTLMYCGDPNDYYPRRTFEKGAYYRVDGILPDDIEKGLYHRLKLTKINTGEQTEEGDIFTDKYNFKWLVVGHYEKMKTFYVNKEYVYLGTDEVFINYSSNKANELISEDNDTVTRNIPKESVWICVGVQVKPRIKSANLVDEMIFDNRSPIVLIFDNPKYGKHYCYLEAGDGKPYKSFLDDSKPYVCGRFQLKSYYDNIKAITATNLAKRKIELTKKFGTANTKLILEGHVRIGMTKAMCRESWGNPDDINKTVGSWGTHEQWVYDNSYLYFEGDKLTAIQN